VAVGVIAGVLLNLRSRELVDGGSVHTHRGEVLNHFNIALIVTIFTNQCDVFLAV
jgi:hypothetical protein